MNRIKYAVLTFVINILLFLTNINALTAQNLSVTSNNDHFFSNLRFGGGLGLVVSNNYTNILVAPSAIYQFEKFAIGAGIHTSYSHLKNYNKSYVYGVDLIGLTNPIPEIQISAEIEQLRINTTYSKTNFKDNFWNTSLFLGVGYSTNNVTVGIRYNVLNKTKYNKIYNTPYMPFIRVYF